MIYLCPARGNRMHVGGGKMLNINPDFGAVHWLDFASALF
jgi:hypothetical protein